MPKKCKYLDQPETRREDGVKWWFSTKQIDTTMSKNRQKSQTIPCFFFLGAKKIKSPKSTQILQGRLLL